jgi:hypothetical protein
MMEIVTVVVNGEEFTLQVTGETIKNIVYWCNSESLEYALRKEQVTL